MSERSRIGKFHKGQVRLLRFSPSSNLIASIGGDENFTMAIHDWKNERLVTAAKVDFKLVLDMDWYSETTLITVGPKHIKFWELKFNNLNSIQGLWGKDDAEPLISVTTLDQMCVTGSARGNIALWSKSKEKMPNVKAHDGPVFCMSYFKSASAIYTGGKDGKVKSWFVKDNQIVPGKLVFDYSSL